MENAIGMPKTDVKKEMPVKLRFSLVKNEQDFDAIQGQWEELSARCNVQIFQTFEWQRTWWKHFGSGNDLQILLFYDGEMLVGIMPLFIDRFRIFGRTIYRSLKLLGSNILQPVGGSYPVDLAFGDYLSWIVLPHYEDEVAAAFQEYLRVNYHCFDELRLDEVPGNGSMQSRLASLPDSSRWVYTEENASTCPLIELPETWNDLLLNLSSNARYQIRRFVKRVTKKDIFEVRTVQSRAEMHKAFEDLVEFHQTRWHRLGQPGIFMDERIHAFFRELTVRFYDKGWLRMKTASAGGQCVAVDLLFQYRGIMYLIQRGYDDTSQFASYSPGKVLLYMTIKEAIEEGFSVYDFLRGLESYKLRTATHRAQNKCISIYPAQSGKHPRLRIRSLVRSSSEIQRKISNERHILNVYRNQKPVYKAVGSYLEGLSERVLNKLNKINS
jgi:CelD/BcsL family acetyltransferase involved in cellulose biosynthesis